MHSSGVHCVSILYCVVAVLYYVYIVLSIFSIEHVVLCLCTLNIYIVLHLLCILYCTYCNAFMHLCIYVITYCKYCVHCIAYIVCKYWAAQAWACEWGRAWPIYPDTSNPPVIDTDDDDLRCVQWYRWWGFGIHSIQIMSEYRGALWRCPSVAKFNWS